MVARTSATIFANNNRRRRRAAHEPVRALYARNAGLSFDRREWNKAANAAVCFCLENCKLHDGIHHRDCNASSFEVEPESECDFGDDLIFDEGDHLLFE